MSYGDFDEPCPRCGRKRCDGDGDKECLTTDERRDANLQGENAKLRAEMEELASLARQSGMGYYDLITEAFPTLVVATPRLAVKALIRIAKDALLQVDKLKASAKTAIEALDPLVDTKKTLSQQLAEDNAHARGICEEQKCPKCVAFQEQEKLVIALGGRRNKDKPLYPNMVWSDTYGMWLDKDTRTSQQKAEDERIAADVERRWQEAKEKP